MELYNSEYTAIHIANYFIDKQSDDLTLFKLIKITYIAFGWGTAILNKRIFPDRMEAWKYGPVIPSLYHTFKYNKKDSIKELAQEIRMNDTNDDIEFYSPRIENDTKIMNYLDIFWGVYKNYKVGHLIDITHKESSPWFKTYDGSLNKRIETELIIKYYNLLFEERKSNLPS